MDRNVDEFVNIANCLCLCVGTENCLSVQVFVSNQDQTLLIKYVHVLDHAHNVVFDFGEHFKADI